MTPTCSGAHRCRHCDPALNLPEIQLGEHHLSVRFGHRAGFGRRFISIATTVDGEPMAAGCAHEAIAGQDGWVQAYTFDAIGDEHPCGCGAGFCETRIFGHVVVVMRGRPVRAKA